MAVELLAMIAVQSPDGMVFGTARGIDGLSLYVEIEAEIPIDAQVEWRMELPGVDETVLGGMRIVKVTRNQTSGVRVYTGNVTNISPDDKDLWEDWRAAVERGVRTVTHTRGGAGAWDSWTREQMMGGTTPAERARAVAYQEERRKRRAEKTRELLGNRKRWPDPTDSKGGQAAADAVWRPLTGSVSSKAQTSVRSTGGTTSGAGTVESRPRAAMAAALRARLGDMGALAARPAGAPPPVLAPVRLNTGPDAGPITRVGLEGTASVPPPPRAPVATPSPPASSTPAPPASPPAAPAPAAAPRPVPVATPSPIPEPAADSAPPAVAEPGVELTHGCLTVTWTTITRYRTDYERDIRMSALRVPGAEWGRPGVRLDIVLVLPSGAMVSGKADIVTLIGGITGFYLQFDALAKQVLAEG